MIKRIGRITQIAVECEVLIVIDTNGRPRLRRKHSTQPCIESWDNQEVTRSLLSNATPASQMESTHIEITRKPRIAIKDMATGGRYWISE